MNLLPRNRVPEMMQNNAEFAYAVSALDVAAMMLALAAAGYESTEQCADYAIVFGEMYLNAEKG